MAKVSIKDVAKHAGVSIATVSHVINNTRFVRDETKQKVLKSIEELNYRPDATARSFKTGRKNLIAFVVPDISNDYFSALIEEIENVLSKFGLHLLVVNTKETEQRELENLKLLSGGMVDGIILASTLSSYKPIAKLIPQSTPLVLIDRYLPESFRDSVTVSNSQAMSSAVEYLIEKGHKKIGYLTGLPRISTTIERLSAYRETMEKHGLPSDGLIRMGTSMSAGVAESLDSLLEEGCTSLIISNNVMAIEAMTLLYVKGLDPRHNIELVGYKDSEQLQYGLHHMHLIKQPVAELGKAAGNLMLERLEHPDMPVQRIILNADFAPRTD
ncbi:MAG TPA: LacI family DNA-binding transcriptional regulator [Candidatus Avilachnospira avistercoris]|nr:LacI family DNA-binding transcriptional regulator [Candidatus Avilachnospira avistercoris]